MERENKLLAGFTDRKRNLDHDQRRQIGYGVWHLRPAAAREPELAKQIRRALRQLLPAAAAALASPDSEGTDWEALGREAQRSVPSTDSRAD